MRETVVGIDLGTTNSVVAVVEGGVPRVILNRSGQPLTPSMVGYTPASARVVGEQARLLREEFPENVAFATKRYLGRRWSAELAKTARSFVPYPLVAGPAGDVRIKLSGKTLPLTQVSAMILGELKLDAEAHLGRPVANAVITVPASFDDAQRQGTKEAARIAGLRTLRILNEPTAAALAYGRLKKLGGRILVFDLGGGTFDVSILEIQDGVYEVKATGGDSHLGGEDFDERIAQWLLAQVAPPFQEAVARDPLSMSQLKVAAERAKRALSSSDEAQISLEGLGDHGEGKRLTRLDTVLTRSFFETLSEPLSRRCLDVCERVLRDSGMPLESLETVLLVGGMTRVPLVRQLVQDFFKRAPESGLNPDEVVAVGAALHAAEVGAPTSRSVLIDVASHSLGVGVVGGRVQKLIPKNSTVPSSAKEVFLPGQKGQTQVRLPIFQGESDYAQENVKLGEVVLTDLKGKSRTDSPIEVSFTLSSEGTLSVRAVDLTTGLSEALRIEARTDLSGAEVDRLRTEQAQYAKGQAGDVKSVSTRRFEQLLERGEKLARVLDAGAKDAPSDAARDAVAHVRLLVENGRTALNAGNTAQMSEVRQKLDAVLLRGEPP